MEEAYNNYISNDKIAFSVDIKQAKNKNNEWKTRVSFLKNFYALLYFLIVLENPQPIYHIFFLRILFKNNNNKIFGILR